jgi:hypothetical protein
VSRLQAFLSDAHAGRVEFQETVSLIDSLFRVTPCAFSVGLPPRTVENIAGANTGALRVFAFAKLLGLDKQTTLNLFGRHYHDVLENPHGDGHANIRAFIRDGWDGVSFSAEPLHALDPSLITVAQHDVAQRLNTL